MFFITKPTTIEYEEIDGIVKSVWKSTYVHNNITLEDVDMFFNGIKDNYENSFIAKDKDKIVGVLTVIDKGDYIYLKQIYILPEYHRKGIGQSLLEQVENKRICLQVSIDNKQAINFYIKQGFHKMNKPDGEFIINGKSIKTTFYCRESK